MTRIFISRNPFHMKRAPTKARIKNAEQRSGERFFSPFSRNLDRNDGYARFGLRRRVIFLFCCLAYVLLKLRFREKESTYVKRSNESTIFKTPIINQTTMNAITRTGYLKSHLRFESNIPIPYSFLHTLKSYEILIKVKAAAINPVDMKIPPYSKLAHEFVGFDVSGIVLSVGPKVTLFQPGDFVFGQSKEGSLAEYTLAYEYHLARIPTMKDGENDIDGDLVDANKSWTFSQAAALPVAYSAAYQGLKSFANVGPSSEVLIIGGSGGCGIAALQMAKALKAKRIIAMTSTTNKDLVFEFGATEIVDYSEAPSSMLKFWSSNKYMLDCVFDTATGSQKHLDYSSKAIKLLKYPNRVTERGKYVQLSGNIGTWIRRKLKLLPSNRLLPLVANTINTHDLEEIFRLLDDSNARPIIIMKPWDPEGLQDALNTLNGHHTRGKVVFEIS